ncbi:hypothetical protein AVEN_181420-1 [Araneus ventricosus]|uniref:Uncharacterized protein n=1 Tax=Araneus ventricosus TaxID=182803 RepID=A0A4Y2SAQ7_ARAVE|nr:hypothetical protein AVEN_181420-1 [Araneus ventricosus]
MQHFFASIFASVPGTCLWAEYPMISVEKAASYILPYHFRCDLRLSTSTRCLMLYPHPVINNLFLSRRRPLPLNPSTFPNLKKNRPPNYSREEKFRLQEYRH